MADQFSGAGNQFPAGSFYAGLEARITALEAAVGTGPGAVPDGAITTPKLADGSVTAAKLAGDVMPPVSGYNWTSTPFIDIPVPATARRATFYLYGIGNTSNSFDLALAVGSGTVGFGPRHNSYQFSIQRGNNSPENLTLAAFRIVTSGTAYTGPYTGVVELFRAASRREWIIRTTGAYNNGATPVYSFGRTLGTMTDDLSYVRFYDIAAGIPNPASIFAHFSI